MSLARLTIILAAAGTLAAQTVTYSYDAAGRLTDVSYPNGSSIFYTYDAAGNLLSRQVKPSAANTPSSDRNEPVRKEKNDKKKTEAPKAMNKAADPPAASESKR